MRCLRFSPCHSSSCFLALRGEVLVGAVWARPLFPPTASLLPSSSSLTGLYLSWNKIQQFALYVSMNFFISCNSRSCQLLTFVMRLVMPNSARYIRLRLKYYTFWFKRRYLPYCVRFGPDAGSPQWVCLIIRWLPFFFRLKTVLPYSLVYCHVVW